MPGLLGKKIGMTSVFSADGKNVPCTVIEVGPCVVTQVKTIEKDGCRKKGLKRHLKFSHFSINNIFV